MEATNDELWNNRRYQIVSLLDMLRFYAEGFVNVSMRLTQIKHTFFLFGLQGTSLAKLPPLPAPPPTIELEWLYETVQALGLAMCTKSTKKLLDYIKSGGEILPIELD
jgi:hypothetical protein